MKTTCAFEKSCYNIEEQFEYQNIRNANIMTFKYNEFQIMKLSD